MITLGNKVVMVRFNTDYPENSPKKWRVLVGEVIFDEELKVERLLEGEAYLVDHVKSICEMTTWSGIVPSGAFKHHLLLMGEHFDVREDEQGQLMAIVGTIKQEEAKEEPTQEPTPVNPELELDAE
jgi:hypothetical protein